MNLKFRRAAKGAEATASQMTLMDHLRELRNRVFKAVCTIVVIAIVAYFVYDPIFRFMTEPYCRSIEGTSRDCQFYLSDLLGGFLLRLKVSMYVGFIGALPVILWQLWRFIMPGLYKNERRYTIAFVASSILLFLLGAALAYYTLPPMLSWLQDSGGPAKSITYIPSPDKYFWLSALMMLAFGVGFEFPLLLIALQIVGVLNYQQLAQVRRYAAVGITAVVAVITPGGDPISLIVLSVPLYLFYEMSIIVGRLMSRSKKKKANELERVDATTSS